MLDWMQMVWIEKDAWYQRTYLVACGTLIISVIVFLIFIKPYGEINYKIDREFRILRSKHLFISFRKKKQRELYDRAKWKVASRDGDYFYYQIGSFAGIISILSLVVAFWFFIGSFVYEEFNEPIQTTPVSDTYDYDSEYYDADGYIEEDSDDNIHHVDPHWVDGYERSDGTQVDGYWRGGDDGYERSDPDGIEENNLNYDAPDDGGSSFFDFFD